MEKKYGLGVFEKYLTLWVAACIITGIAIGKYLPAFPAALGKLEYANVSLPVAVLIWLMIYPMMLKIGFNWCEQLAHQAIYHVWHCLVVLDVRLWQVYSK